MVCILLAGMTACWMGLVKVDRQIRSVTINCSPPLWETKEEGELLTVTLMGKSVTVDLSPLREMGEGLERVLQTPSAPERIWQGIRELLPRMKWPEYRPEERQQLPRWEKERSFTKEFV